MHIGALVNDTVGTLAAVRYIDGQDTIAAMIMGTGTPIAPPLETIPHCNSYQSSRMLMCQCIPSQQLYLRHKIMTEECSQFKGQFKTDMQWG